jgi:predicted ATP-grasp superfamily ATP-dependent carboligase
MRRAIASDFGELSRRGRPLHVTMTLDARLPDEPGPWTVARMHDTDDADHLRQLARAADFTVLVAPETTGILANLTHALGRSGARLLGSSADAVALAGDKERTAHWLQSRGIATPRTVRVSPVQGLPADFDYPAVLKPVDGAGSIDTFYVSGARRLPAAARAMQSALLQTYVAGQPSSASFLVDDERRAWLIGVGTQLMVIRHGRFEYRGGSLPAAWRHASEPLRRAVEGIPGLRGFVGVDFIWDSPRDHAMIIDVNPRPTTSYVGLRRLLPAGRIAQAWLAARGHGPTGRDLLEGLAALVHRHEPVAFDATGRFLMSSGVPR